MTQMTADRIYRDKMYYIKYDGAIRACKVLYYKAHINSLFENKHFCAVLHIAGVGKVLFRDGTGGAFSDAPEYDI